MTAGIRPGTYAANWGAPNNITPHSPSRWLKAFTLTAGSMGPSLNITSISWTAKAANNSLFVPSRQTILYGSFNLSAGSINR